MRTTVDPDKVDELASEYKRLSSILEDSEIGLYREMFDLIRETNAEYDEGYVRNTTAEMENLIEEIHNLAQSITGRLNNKSKVLNRAAEQYRRDEDAARELLAQPPGFSFDEMLGSLSTFFGQAKKVVSGVVDDVLDACLPDFIEDALYDEPSVNLPLEVAPLKGNLSINPKVCSAEVKDLQQRLRELGYYVKVDGYFTQQTLAAVNAYKNKHGIANVGENAGVVDNQTWFWLNGGLTGKLKLDPEKYSEQVKMAQIQLKDKGYNVEVTGYFDEKTLKAVNGFKENHRIGNTGKWEGSIGPQTWGVLFGLPSVAIPQAIQGMGNSKTNNPVSVKFMQVEGSSPYPAISAYGAKITASGSSGIVSGNAHATAGVGEAYAKAVVGFEPNWNGTKVKGGKVQEVCGVDLRANAEVSAAEAGAYGQLGNNQFGVDGDLHGHVGEATAYAGFTARLDGDQQGLGFRAGAEAAVFEGNASMGLTLLGHEVEVGVEGTAIGVGAKAELGVINGRLKGRAKAALGLGGGFFFSIGEKK